MEDFRTCGSYKCLKVKGTSNPLDEQKFQKSRFHHAMRKYGLVGERQC